MCYVLLQEFLFGRQNLSVSTKNNLHTNNIEALLYILSETDDCIVLI